MTSKLPPYRQFLASDNVIRDLLRTCRSVAVVGLTGGAGDPARAVVLELRRRGYRVLPVGDGSALPAELPCHASLRAIDEPIGIVDVHLAPQAVPAVVEEACAAGATALWLEPCAANAEAAYEASRRGMVVVLNRRILVEYAMHFEDEEGQ